LLLVVAYGQQVPGCTGKVNNESIITTPPELVAKVPNGKKYVTPYDGRFFYTLVLNGSAYDMGLAHGQLMKEEINEMLPVLMAWFEKYLQTNVTEIARLPVPLKKWIAKTAVWLGQGLLDLNFWVTNPYTNPRFDQELQGMSLGSGIPLNNLRQMNLIGEMLKASCSILGAYGKSTASGKTVHLRALDWEAHAPQNRWPQITVYHSNEPNSIPYANIAWPAYIGVLTGYNAAKVGVGERLWGKPWREETRFGTPWQYVLRDGLQFSKSQPDYIQHLKDAQRTCSIYLGVGGENYFNILKYTAKFVDVYAWNTWGQDINHPQLEDVLWKAYKDNNPCFANLVTAEYGKITAEYVIRNIAPLGETGDSQVVVMDYATNQVYCMYPNPVTSNPGYNAPTVMVDLSVFFNPAVLN